MATISLLIPSWHYWADPLKLQPLWELYYATILRDAFPSHDIKVIDTRESPARLETYEPPESDIYVYWIMKSADAFEIYDRVTQLRMLYPASWHIAGGTHVDHLPEQCALHFDVVLNGTAEDTMVSAVKTILSGETPTKIFKSNNHCHFSSYPVSERSFIPVNRVSNRQHLQKYGGVLGTGAYFSRGCSFRCKFCVYNNPPKFEFRNPEQITSEIEYLKKEYGIEGINLRDEVCIPVNRKEAIPYLDAIGKGDIIWRGQSVPLGSEEMVKLAAESGLREVALGIESGDSDQVLTISNKPSKSIENNKRYIELVKKYGIKVKICLIFGLPGESEHVYERTIRFIEEVEPDYVAVSGFDPVPGSPFYNQPDKYGIKSIDSNLAKHAHLIYRFGNEEDVGLPFEYKEVTPWGKSLSREKIIHNLQAIQEYVRARELSY